MDSSSTKVGESSTSPMKSSEPATPRKRKRSSSPLIKSVHSQKQKRKQEEQMSQTSTSILLLDTPNLLAVPPNHKTSTISYIVSLNALRKCLATQGGLSPDMECRAYTALAELALKVVRAGWTQDKIHPWAKNLESEVSPSFND